MNSNISDAVTSKVNSFMTAAYWLIGWRIVEFEQGGKTRAEYGKALLKKLSADLTNRHERGYGVDNLQRFRSFYLAYQPEGKYATSPHISSAKGFKRMATAETFFPEIAKNFPLGTG